MVSIWQHHAGFMVFLHFPHGEKNIYICLYLLAEQKHFEAVLEKEERLRLVNGSEDTVQVSTISSNTQTVLKSLFMVLGFLFRQNCRSLSLT